MLFALYVNSIILWVEQVRLWLPCWFGCVSLCMLMIFCCRRLFMICKGWLIVLQRSCSVRYGIQCKQVTSNY